MGSRVLRFGVPGMGVFLLGLLILFPSPGEPARVLTPVPPVSAEGLAPGTNVELAVVGAAARAAPAEGHGRAAAPGPPPAVPQAASGEVFGAVWDARGRPLPRRVLSFATTRSPFAMRPDAPPAGPAFRCRTDDQGAYAWKGAPPGSYFVFSHEPRETGAECLRSVGTVEVVAGRATPFDVVLFGERTLAGRVTVAESEFGRGVLLALELRHARSGEVVAAGTVTTFDRAAGLPPGASSPEGERRGAQGEAPVAGRFLFDALEAGSYTLRITLGHDGEGREVFVERSIDLHERDVTLEHEELSLEDFFAAR